MWRTTYAFGASGFALMLAYVAISLASDAHHGLPFRIFAAGPLLLGAWVCARTAVRCSGWGKNGRSASASLEAPTTTPALASSLLDRRAARRGGPTPRARAARPAARGA
jgi:hypothetical protein